MNYLIDALKEGRKDSYSFLYQLPLLIFFSFALTIKLKWVCPDGSFGCSTSHKMQHTALKSQLQPLSYQVSLCL